MQIGVLAEEQNDVDVLYALTCKLVNPTNFSFRKFVGHGCGKLRNKCTAWAKNLLQSGCKHLILLHDLDNNNEANLRTELTSFVRSVGFDGYVILIPVREIEAWLLSDAEALRISFNMRRIPKVPTRPELVLDPKEKLEEIVWKYSKKRYINTIHNPKIAAAMEIRTLSICRSFQSYPNFVTSTFATQPTVTSRHPRRRTTAIR